MSEENNQTAVKAKGQTCPPNRIWRSSVFVPSHLEEAWEPNRGTANQKAPNLEAWSRSSHGTVEARTGRNQNSWNQNRNRWNWNRWNQNRWNWNQQGPEPLEPEPEPLGPEPLEPDRLCPGRDDWHLDMSAARCDRTCDFA